MHRVWSTSSSLLLPSCYIKLQKSLWPSVPIPAPQYRAESGFSNLETRWILLGIALWSADSQGNGEKTGFSWDCFFFQMPFLTHQKTKKVCPLFSPQQHADLRPSQPFPYCTAILCVCLWPVRPSNAGTVWTLTSSSLGHGTRKIVDVQ